jgi:hypothetical protein
MPIGATIGAGVIGAVGAVGASAMSSHAQSQAAQQASGTEMAVAQENNDLAREIYGENAARLDPYSQMGLPAGAEYNALLGIAVPPGAANPQPLPTGAGTGTGAGSASPPSMGQIMAMQNDGIPGNYASSLSTYYAAHPPSSTDIAAMRNDGIPGNYAAATAAAAHPTNALAPVAGAPVPVSTPAQAPAPAPAGAATPPAAGGGGTSPTNALSGFNTFYNSPTYQVPLQRGLEGVNTKYAAAGAIESGAAEKAIDDYAAGNAAGALGTYMDALYRQEALGMSASSALAGVGQNMVSQVSANNNAAGSAAANAQLVAGQGSANTWNALGSGFGQIAGSVAGAMGSSYHPNNAAISVNPGTTNYFAQNPFGGPY